MLLIGLLLVLAALAAGGAVVYDGAETTRVEFFGHSATMSVAGIYFAGVATMIVFFLGLWLMAGSLRRSSRKRAARREARLEHRESVQTLEDERAQLAEENARLERQLQERRAGAAVGTPTGTAGAGAYDDRTRSMAARRDLDGDGIPDSQESSGSHRAVGPTG